MQRIFLFSFLLLSHVAFCQTEDSILNATRKNEMEDSLTALIKSMGDSIGNAPADFNTNTGDENINPGLDYFVRMEERRKAEEKKTASLKIILGVLLLGIVIIGLTVKVKKERE